MFLHTNLSQTGYTRDGQQKAGGPFLILFTWYPPPLGSAPVGTTQYTDGARVLPIVRACVRSVRMSQCGHWMMGSAQIGAARITLSGAYGSDGLTCDADRYPGVWDTLIELPRELTTALWNGGGHNSAGSEAPAMRAWAIANVVALRKAGKVAAVVA